MRKKAEVVVYKAVNLVNGKFYIGVTRKGLPCRQRQHQQTATRGRGYRLHKAMRKYGCANFAFSVIAKFDVYDHALLYEISAIARLKPDYNLTRGGAGLVLR